MPPHTDLETALEFVTRRVEEEADRSGRPLSEEEHFLLHHLPTGPGVFSLPSWGFNPETGGVDVAVRDLDYERLCSLAKAAYEGDIRRDPSSPYRWEFAAAVTRLNHHPMAWLLQWAGIKVRRQWWDRWALIAASLVFVSLALLLAIFLATTERNSPLWWILAGAGCIAFLSVLVFVSRRMESWQLKQTVEKCRRSSQFGSHGID